MRTLWAIGLVLIFASCKTSGGASNSASSYANYQENLSSSLPVYPDYSSQVNSEAASNSNISVQAVDAQLDIIDENLVQKNKSEPYFSGFTVLIYSGVDREKAFKSQRDLTELYPELDAEMQYDQPRYLVKIGRFAHKIEAQKSLVLVKPDFPSARIIRDRFQRKEFGSPIENDNNVEGEN